MAKLKHLRTQQVKHYFGDFKYREGHEGRIIQSKKFLKNIVEVQTDLIHFKFHVKLKKLITAAFEEIIAYEKKTGKVLINPKDFGGSFVPRHIHWSRKRPLSRYSWGIAMDVNYTNNLKNSLYKRRLNLGAHSWQPHRLKQIMAKYGFEWGGNWRSYKDGMHFEFANIALLKSGKIPYSTYKKRYFVNDTEIESLTLKNIAYALNKSNVLVAKAIDTKTRSKLYVHPL
ncbi:MAG: M15 family metallopeptidase [Thermodesulfobacteriota bacterium]